MPHLIHFDGKLRPSQQDVVEVASRQLGRGNRRLHINAPPGSGKTVLGLYLWSQIHQGTALVLSPNTAIAAQWITQTQWFSRKDGKPISSLVSPSAKEPNLLTSVTYQSLAAIDPRNQIDPRNEEGAPNVPFFFDDQEVVSRLSDHVIDRMVALREFGVGMLILDECHHLTGHWATVIEKLIEQLANPIVLGLTGTPPDPESLTAASLARYDRLLGPVDHEVLIPTVVKGGHLAPYQDLLWMVEPTQKEREYINHHRVDSQGDSPPVPIRSVLAHSSNKRIAAVTILKNERSVGCDQTRAVVLTDFVKHVAIQESVESVLDPEAGGAVAVMRAVLDDLETNGLDPVLVTGTTVLVDPDSIDGVLRDASAWIQERKLRVKLSIRQHDDFSELCGSGSDWGPQTYVLMITELFRRGITKCLIGTRGLLGEGWDAPCVNVLIDLTSAATSTSVRQIRGRAIRIDPQQPSKVSNHWDVLCLMLDDHLMDLDDQPDYQRLVRKHDAWFGVCDDGAIEKGVRHLHPDLDESSIALDSAHGLHRFNADMILRSSQRELVHQQWRVGETFEGIPQSSLDVHWPSSEDENAKNEDKDRVLELVAMADCVYETLIVLGKAEPHGRVRVSKRQNNHYRIQWEGVHDSTRDQCCSTLMELLAPLQSPRYVIERCVPHAVYPRWSGWLPNVLRCRLARNEHVRVAWHCVPSTIARRRKQVDLFQRLWHRYVGQGEVVFLPRDRRTEFVQSALLEHGFEIDRVSRREVLR